MWPRAPPPPPPPHWRTHPFALNLPKNCSSVGSQISLATIESYLTPVIHNVACLGTNHGVEHLSLVALQSHETMHVSFDMGSAIQVLQNGNCSNGRSIAGTS